MSKVLIRKMTKEDIDQVLHVERSSFAVPWDKDIYIKELTENRYAYYSVVEADGHVVGFCGLWVVIDEAQITNIAILPALRGKKYGSALFQYVLNQAVALGAARLSLEVRQSNLVAQKLYSKYGLVPGGIRKNYYTDNNEDALVMWVNL
ncbi:ribosomal protein S18-alanine N-acetyltransferase [Aquibacillus koreensis]|uniref:[Ribosomal protein bS18]-alanine N-acetyltransferase n=1 Tax=Aquibacillus koreensis TaxID=279446 RepID=A0A9X3WQK5_9BACI|nr:ribosomal protein S18-alanine N-acetyltransferase [Aquibacillus koreensis]MCT2536695.1 ribosomal protein S18-alanine N-acetyltransferase [Aquibacillus koreensis]MDC3421549.1 ribosomal protein S18-alanine N-acetyltransferase [Aquibacillus koreensis]